MRIIIINIIIIIIIIMSLFAELFTLLAFPKPLFAIA